LQRARNVRASVNSPVTWAVTSLASDCFSDPLLISRIGTHAISPDQYSVPFVNNPDQNSSPVSRVVMRKEQ